MSCAWLPRCLAGCALAVTLRVRRCRPYFGLYELHLIRYRISYCRVFPPRPGPVRYRSTVRPGAAAWDCTSLYPVASLVRSARGLCSCYAVEATRSLCRDCACVGLC